MRDIDSREGGIVVQGGSQARSYRAGIPVQCTVILSRSCLRRQDLALPHRVD
jgi:hypothetical protein